MDYLRALKKSGTQQEKTDPSQIQNNAGGYSFTVTQEQQFLRFLLLGSETGTYYVNQTKLTLDNLAVLQQLVQQKKAKQCIDLIVEVSTQKRAAKNDPALFALAYLSSVSTAFIDNQTTVAQYALQQLNSIARTGTHLFHFIAYARQFRGWGRSLKRAIKNWYAKREPDALAYQITKYQQRDGWSHRDILRLTHPNPKKEANEGIAEIYHYIAKGEYNGSAQKIQGIELLKQLHAKEASLSEVAAAVTQYGLTQEMVPSIYHTKKEVLLSLMPMPDEALVRGLGKLTAHGVLDPYADITDTSIEQIRTLSTVHPIKILNALVQYEHGSGDKGHLTWNPVGRILDALDAAFYTSFRSMKGTGKRILVCIDTSASMHRSVVNGMAALSLHRAAGALALLFLNTEQKSSVIGVDTEVQELAISPRQRLDDVVRLLDKTGGRATNLALPYEYLTEKKRVVDSVIMLTDHETWAGKTHPYKALEHYRRTFNEQLRIVHVAMTATEMTVSHPNDRRSIDIVGFDTNAPVIIHDFLLELF